MEKQKKEVGIRHGHIKEERTINVTKNKVRVSESAVSVGLVSPRGAEDSINLFKAEASTLSH